MALINAFLGELPGHQPAYFCWRCWWLSNDDSGGTNRCASLPPTVVLVMMLGLGLWLHRKGKRMSGR